MFCISRLSSRKLASQIVYATRPESISLIRHVMLQPSPYKPDPKETHDERNMRLGRPQSPHLTIYAPQLQTLQSMFHRVTGAALSGYTILFATATLALPQKLPHYIDMLQALNLGPIPIMLGKFVLAFPLCYHLCNGLRHLIWDLGVLLSMKAVLATGYTVILIVLAATSVLLII